MCPSRAARLALAGAVTCLCLAAAIVSRTAPAARAQFAVPPPVSYPGECIPPQNPPPFRFGAPGNTVTKSPLLIISTYFQRKWQADFALSEVAHHADLIPLPPGGLYSHTCLTGGVFSANWVADVSLSETNFVGLEGEVVGWVGVEHRTESGGTMCIDQQRLRKVGGHPAVTEARAFGKVEGQTPNAVRIDMMEESALHDSRITRVTFDLTCGSPPSP